MPMTGAGLAAARRAAIDAVSYTQTSSQSAAESYSDAVLLADSTAIVTYIQGNALAVGTDTGTNGGDSHALTIT